MLLPLPRLAHSVLVRVMLAALADEVERAHEPLDRLADGRDLERPGSTARRPREVAHAAVATRDEVNDDAVAVGHFPALERLGRRGERLERLLDGRAGGLGDVDEVDGEGGGHFGGGVELGLWLGRGF